jgi:hypothetical protein
MAYVKDVYVGKAGVVKPHEHNYQVVDKDGKHVAYHMNLDEAKRIADEGLVKDNLKTWNKK